jgi:hypothetical protein
MTICSNCNEYEAVNGTWCSICEWRGECERAQAEVSTLVLGITRLPITVGSKKKIADEFIPGLLNELNNFHDRRPPNVASPIGYAAKEDVTEITSRIKEVGWENLCSLAKTAIEIIGLRFPPLVKESDLAQLLFIIGDGQFESIMVSAIGDCGVSENITALMNSLGFIQVEDIDTNKIQLEVTVGYFSYLRGDSGASPQRASVLTAERYEFLKDYMFKKQDNYVGISKYKDRRVMHLVGPKNNLPGLLLAIINNPSTRIHCGSLVGDLEIALRHLVMDLTRKVPGNSEEYDEADSRRPGGRMLHRILNWFIKK